MRTCSEQDRRNRLRNLCRTDLYFLLRYGLNRPDVENPWLYDRCREVQGNPDEHLDLWAREHYKSTIITYAKTIQDILASHGDDPLPEYNGIELTFGLFSHTRPVAKGFLRQIKRELEANEFLIDLFPDVLYPDPRKSAPKWSEDDGLVVVRKSNPKESTIEAWGLVDGQPTSKHFWRMVFDDIVSLDSVRSGDMIRKTTESLEMAYNLGTDGGRKRFVGTIYDDADTWSVILDRGTATKRIYPCTHNGKADGIPVFMSEEKLREKVRDMGPYVFSCQMLLDPIPADNAFFKRDYFIVEDSAPKTMNVYGCSDYAVTEGDGDYTEHGVFGIDHEGRPWIIDWWSGQTTSDVWIETQLDLIIKHKPYVWVGEAGPIRRSIEPFLVKRMRSRSAYCRLEWMPSIHDKPTRARPFQALVAHHGLRLVKAAWNENLIKQCMRFPKSNTDDKVDTCSLFGRALQETYAAPLPESLEDDGVERDCWGRRIRYDDNVINWKVV